MHHFVQNIEPRPWRNGQADPGLFDSRKNKVSSSRNDLPETDIHRELCRTFCNMF